MVPLNCVKEFVIKTKVDLQENYGTNRIDEDVRFKTKPDQQENYGKSIFNKIKNIADDLIIIFSP